VTPVPSAPPPFPEELRILSDATSWEDYAQWFDPQVGEQRWVIVTLSQEQQVLLDKLLMHRGQTKDQTRDQSGEHGIEPDREGKLKPSWEQEPHLGAT
jgi:hypothetical protein